MLFLYFLLYACFNDTGVSARTPPLSHQEIIDYRQTNSAAINAEKTVIGTQYDAVAILSLANKATSNFEYFSRLIQGVSLGYGFKNGVRSSLSPSANDRKVFEAALKSASIQLLRSSALPTGPAVWSDINGDYTGHATVVAGWLGAHKSGTLDMEYQVPATPYNNYSAASLVGGNLEVNDNLSGLILTNVSIRKDLYFSNYLQVTNCHPYNPTEIRGEEISALEKHPVVIEYKYSDFENNIPPSIKNLVAGKNPRLFLNVQDNPWNGNQLLLRPHAIQWMFPSDDFNFTGVQVYAVDDTGQEILQNHSGSVHIHPADKQIVASPNNMLLQKIDHTKPIAFYSAVVYNGMAAVTRHIFLTPEQCEKLQNKFDPGRRTYNSAEFIELLTSRWKDFLIRVSIPLA